MGSEDFSNELLEKIKACKTGEEKAAVLKEYDIEIPDDMLDEVTGGANEAPLYQPGDPRYCPVSKDRHIPKRTGRKRKSPRWTPDFPEMDEEFKCVFCGKIDWY